MRIYIRDKRLSQEKKRMTTKISIETYGKYSSDNYGAHCQRLDIGCLTLWFSYKTVIAFRDWSGDKAEFQIRVNDWSTTTGKHLNAIDEDKKKRISGEVFEMKLNDCLQRHELNLV